jgi:alcohol dehydrogenase class IV
MESLQYLVQTLFGGSIEAQEVLAVFVALYSIVMSIYEWRAKLKLIRAEKEKTVLEEKMETQSKELTETRQALALLGDLVCTAYLTNINVDASTKRKLSEIADKLRVLANLNLETTTVELIQKVQSFKESLDMATSTETILTEAKAVEEVLDNALNSAASVLENLEV